MSLKIAKKICSALTQEWDRSVAKWVALDNICLISEDSLNSSGSGFSGWRTKTVSYKWHLKSFKSKPASTKTSMQRLFFNSKKAANKWGTPTSV